jgi:hypothetical protein
MSTRSYQAVLSGLSSAKSKPVPLPIVDDPPLLVAVSHQSTSSDRRSAALPLSATSRNDVSYDPNPKRPANRGYGPGPMLSKEAKSARRKLTSPSTPSFTKYNAASDAANKRAECEKIQRTQQADVLFTALEESSVDSGPAPSEAHTEDTSSVSGSKKTNPHREARGKLYSTSVVKKPAVEKPVVPTPGPTSGSKRHRGSRHHKSPDTSEVASVAESIDAESVASTAVSGSTRGSGRSATRKRSKRAAPSLSPSVAPSAADSELRSVEEPTVRRTRPVTKRPGVPNWAEDQLRRAVESRDFYVSRLETDLQLLLLEVRRDGNCLPDALTVLTTGSYTPTQSSKLRAELVAYAHSRKDVHRFIHARSGKSFQDWIAHTLEDGSWFDHIHIMLMEELYEIRINVYLVGGSLMPLPCVDVAPYQAIAHRPVRALLFDSSTHLYQPLLCREGVDRLPRVHTQLLAAARRDLWRDYELPVTTLPTPPRPPTPTLALPTPAMDVSEPLYDPDVVVPRLGHRPATLSTVFPEVVPDLRASSAPQSSSSRQPPTAPDRQRPLFTTADLAPLPVVPGRAPTAAALPGSIDNLQYPHVLGQFANFQVTTSAMPVSLLQCVQPVLAAAAPPEAFLLAVHQCPGLFPNDWAALAQCDIAAYQCVAEVDAGFILRLINCLWFGYSGRGQAIAAPWPEYTVLSPRSPWYLQYRPPLDVVAVVPRQPSGFDTENLGVSQYMDKVGLTHTITKSAFPGKIRRMESLSVLAGTDRLHVLLNKAGFFAYNLVSSVLLPAAIREYTAAQLLANPHNLYPVVPVYELAWYLHKDTEDLCMRVFCFEFVSFLELPDSTGLRLAHFLPASITKTLVDGVLTHRDHWLRALEGVGASFGVLYSPAYEIQFTALVAEVRRLQLGASLSALFVESIIVNRLAAFYSFTAALDVSFTLPNDPEVYRPRELSPQRWASIMRSDLLQALRSATELHDLMFTKNVGNGPALPVPIGLRSQARQHESSSSRVSGQPAAAATTSSSHKQASQASPRSILCIPSVLHHYGLEAADCPRGSSCTYTHYTGVRGWPLHKARTAVQAAKLSSAQEESLLSKMERDPKKFPSTSDRSPTKKSPKPKVGKGSRKQ